MIEILNSLEHTSSKFDLLRKQLNEHKLYCAIDNEHKLKVFMEHHVYAVWDFMSLIKALQMHIAPITLPWTPPKSARYANFINQLVLEEESDYALTATSNTTHASHFESYLLAMDEVGADTQAITTFVNTVNRQGIESALSTHSIPHAAKRFMQFTFDIIAQNEPHLLAAALAYGREDLVPQMFRSLEESLKISPQQAPNLYAYLQRHIQLDGEEHGPLAIQLLNELCEQSEQKHSAAANVAERALAIRLDFWDGIYDAIQH